MKTYTIKFKVEKAKSTTLVKDESSSLAIAKSYYYIFTDSEKLLEDYYGKYLDREIDNLIIINEETNVVYDYDNTPSLARKERANG